ncbi:hypothetical protein SOVF_172310 [Spinacia oleracea]|nr:hypothetical protein SOVF_172310 [Spinacia oleracea]
MKLDKEYITPKYLIYNPLTKENFYFCEERCRIWGFFFHQLERDYKLLVYRFDKINQTCHYYMYGFNTKDKRKLGSFPYYPLLFNNHAVLVCGALFWLVAGLKTKECSKSIMMFDLKSENIHVMPHLGPTCTHSFYLENWKLHYQMVLLEIDGRLSLSNVCKETVEVWILEDLANWMWVKKYVVNLDIPFDHDACRHSHPVVLFQSGNLLLNWPARGPFWCNLSLNYLCKIKLDLNKVDSDFVFYATKYTSNFGSLRGSNIFYDSFKSCDIFPSCSTSL